MVLSSDIILCKNKSALRTLRYDHKQNLILWPVQCYRVIAAPKQHLNLFKRSILQLIGTGVGESFELAKLLSLDKRLIDYLLKYELSRYVKRGRLTDQGQNLINNGQNQSEATNLQELYFFADAFTGRLLPRVEKRLPALSSDLIVENDKGRLMIQMGSKGEGKKASLSPFTVSFPRSSVAEPTEKSFAYALKRYEDLCRNREGYEEGMTLADKDEQIDLKSISGIKAIEMDEPAFLLTALMPREDRDRSWTFFDPFELGYDNEFSPLADIVDQHITVSENRSTSIDHFLKNKLDHFLERKSNDSEEATFSESYIAAKEKVELKLKLELDNRVHSALREHVASAYIEYENYLEVYSESRSEQIPKYQQENFTSNFLKNGVKALETLFEFVWDKERDQKGYDAIKYFVRNGKIQKRQVTSILDDLERALKYTSEYYFGYLIQHSSERLRNVAESGTDRGQFKAQVVLALLSARNNVKHPLRHALKHKPEIINFCFKLSEERNKTSHGGVNKSPHDQVILSPKEMKERLDHLIETVKLISENHSEFNTEEV